VTPDEARILRDCEALVAAGQATWQGDTPGPTLCHYCQIPAPDGYCLDFVECNYRARRRLHIPVHICMEHRARDRAERGRRVVDISWPHETWRRP
jgi:hypothetical protein